MFTAILIKANFTQGRLVYLLDKNQEKLLPKRTTA